MAGLKEQLQKKSLQEIDAMIFDHNQKIEAERDLITLGRLNSELSLMREIREEKLKKGGHVRRSAASPDKPDLKSYDDYVNSHR